MAGLWCSLADHQEKGSGAIEETPSRVNGMQLSLWLVSWAAINLSTIKEVTLGVDLNELLNSGVEVTMVSLRASLLQDVDATPGFQIRHDQASQQQPVGMVDGSIISSIGTWSGRSGFGSISHACSSSSSVREDRSRTTRTTCKPQ